MFILNVLVNDERPGVVRAFFNKLREITTRGNREERDNPGSPPDKFIPSNPLQGLFGGILLFGERRRQQAEEKEKQDDERARSALSSASAGHWMVQISALLKIAQSNLPSWAKSLAAGMLNDALSHLKGQNVGEDRASNLVSLLGSSNDEVRESIGSAISDAEEIKDDEEENGDDTRTNITSVNPTGDNPAFENVYGVPDDFLNRDLTKA